jgi:hypothetical protein
MAEKHVLEKPKADSSPKEEPEAGPSGATDKTKEREKKFDEASRAVPTPIELSSKP